MDMEGAVGGEAFVFVGNTIDAEIDGILFGSTVAFACAAPSVASVPTGTAGPAGGGPAGVAGGGP